MDEQYAVAVQDLCRSFTDKQLRRQIQALQHLNLKIQRGHMTAIIGPDGAGKTTLLRLLCGLLAPDGGSVAVLGLDATKDAQAIQDRISYMPQRFGLYEDLTVQENLDLYADLHGVSKEQRAQRFARLLKMTGLAPFTQRLAGKLSGGMKQKLGLACTLVRSPELLLLDEPTVGVDPLSRRELWEIIQEMVSTENLTVIVTTAYMEEAALCQEVFVLYEGQLLFQGVPDALRNLAANRCFLVQPPAATPSRVVQACLLDDSTRVLDAVPQGGWVRCILQRPEQLPELKVYQYFGKLATAPVPPRLEDGFMLLLRQQRLVKEQQSASQAHQVIPGKAASINNDASSSQFAMDYTQSFTLGEAIDIEVQQLVRKFGDFIAVDNTSFAVRRGEIFGLLGPNGAGKTTTFKMLCGLLPATSGSLAVAGVNLRTARTQARANIGYVAQKFSLYPTMTVDENLNFYGGVYGLSDARLKQRISAVKHEFQLADAAATPAEQLPGGYKQRLSMAAALLHEPRILFLDEPTSGIDPLARRSFWRQITALAAHGTTIIITTHFMEEAEYCDRIMIQDQGKMLALGTPAAIRCQEKQTDNMNEAFIAIVEAARRREAQP
ncbi:MAG: ATP-binding cassette domain-containing protein [Phascolarctobacterium sp.]